MYQVFHKFNLVTSSGRLHSSGTQPVYIVHQTLPEVGPVYKTKYTHAHTHVTHTRHTHVTHTHTSHTHVTYTRHTHTRHTHTHVTHTHVTHTHVTHTHITQAELELVLVIAHGQMNMTTTLSNLSVATTTYQSRYTPIAKVTNLIDQILARLKVFS